jgi:CheY-like chemotaxis protein
MIQSAPITKMNPRNENAVLIVENSESDAEFLQQTLKDIGVTYPVRVALNSTEAVAYIEGIFPYSNRARYPLPRMIFLDLNMRGVMDGFILLEWFKNRPTLAGALIIALSNVEDLASIRRAYGLGAHSFLSKPCQAADLENVICSFSTLWETYQPHSHAVL